jgi:hypothetical protein
MSEIPGYQHPEKQNTNRSGVYKTFTEGQKTTKNFGKTNLQKQYASYKDYDDKLCANCNELIVTCKCKVKLNK